MQSPRLSTIRPSLAGPWFLFLLSTLMVSSQNAFAIVGLPILSNTVSYSTSQLGLLLAVYPLTQAITSLVAGPLSDRLPRHRVILIGQAIFALGLSLHFFAESFIILILLRSVAGIGAGILSSVPLPYLTDQYVGSAQRPALGRAASGHALGQAFGIPLGILFLDTLSFLHLTTCCGLLAWILFGLKLRQLPKSLEAIAFPAEKTSSQLSGSASAHSGFKLLLLVSLMCFFATSLFYVTTTLWLTRGLGLSPRILAAIYLVGGLIQFIVLIYLIPKLNHVDPFRLLIISLLGNGVTLLAWVVFMNTPLLACAFFTLAMGTTALRISPVQFLVANLGAPASKGMRSSLNQGCQMIGRSLGNYLGSVASNGAAPTFNLISASLLILASGCIWTRYVKQPCPPLNSPVVPNSKVGIGTHSAKLKMSSKQSS
jgi:predicted MFS family arabinose efflux permease